MWIFVKFGPLPFHNAVIYHVRNRSWAQVIFFKTQPQICKPNPTQPIIDARHGEFKKKNRNLYDNCIADT